MHIVLEEGEMLLGGTLFTPKVIKLDIQLVTGEFSKYIGPRYIDRY